MVNPAFAVSMGGSVSSVSVGGYQGMMTLEVLGSLTKFLRFFKIPQSCTFSLSMILFAFLIKSVRFPFYFFEQKCRLKSRREMRKYTSDLIEKCTNLSELI